MVAAAVSVWIIIISVNVKSLQKHFVVALHILNQDQISIHHQCKETKWMWHRLLSPTCPSKCPLLNSRLCYSHCAGLIVRLQLQVVLSSPTHSHDRLSAGALWVCRNLSQLLTVSNAIQKYLFFTEQIDGAVTFELMRLNLSRLFCSSSRKRRVLSDFRQV